MKNTIERVFIMLLILLVAGCSSQSIVETQQVTITPTAPVTTLTPTAIPPHPLAITAENASSLKLEKVIGAGRVNDVAWSPLGDVIAVAQDFDILFYDSASLELIENVGFGGTEVVFSPDGLFVAIAKDINILIWDIDTKVIAQEFKTDIARIKHVLYNSDGSCLAILGDSNLSHDPEFALEVWNVNAGEKIVSKQGYDSNANIAFSPDGETLAFVNVAGIILMQIETGEEKKIDMTGENGSLAYISDDFILKRLDHNQLKVIDLRTLETLDLISVDGSYSEFKISPDKKKIIFPSFWDNEKYLMITQVWDLETEKLSYTLDFESDVTRIDFSPDSKYFVSADDDGYVRIHDLKTGETVDQIEFTTYVQDIESVSRNTLAVEYSRGHVRIWNLDTDEVVRKFGGFPYWNNILSVSLDRKFIFIWRDYSTVDIWEIEAGVLRYTVNCPDQKTMDSAYLIEGNKSVLIECGGYSDTPSIFRWNLESQKRILLSSDVMLTGMPVDNRLVVIRNMGTRGGFYVADVPEVEIVDVVKEKMLFKLKFDESLYYLDVSDVSFSADGKMVALLDSNAAILVWKTYDSIQKYTLIGHESPTPYNVTDIAFSPYGYLLASAGYYDKTVRLWDTDSGKQIAVLDDLFAPVNSVAFSLDGRYLIAGCDDGRIYVWSIDL